jgi:hypothetical protein
MNEVISFIKSIITELVAASLLIILGGILSKKARWLLTVILGRLLDIDVEYVFRNKREADDDIRKEIDRSSFVYLLTGRGSDLQRDTYTAALGAGNKGRRPKFRILLPVTKPVPSEPDWTWQREQEVAMIDPGYGKGILRDQIETTARFLSNYTSTGNVELRRFNYPHIGRILITDRAAYFTPYRQDMHGRDSNVIKYRRGGEMFEFYLRLFNQLWEYEGERGVERLETVVDAPVGDARLGDHSLT